MNLRLLQSGDEAALDTFLARHADSSMFLRSNARAAGFVDRGRPLQGTYAAVLVQGEIVAVAAHCWNGSVLVQAPVRLEDVVRAAVQRSGRAVGGLAGPWSQVTAARRALRLEERPTAKASREELYALNLRELLVPPALAEGRLLCRRPRKSELDLLIEWRVGFALEALGAANGAELRTQCRDEVVLHHGEGSDWVLLDGDTPVAYSVFNARLPEIVQIGGVWTPPALRGRGYARAVVAGSLLEARGGGVGRAVLFTDPGNPPAGRAYRALGFQVVGDYGLVLFEQVPR